MARQNLAPVVLAEFVDDRTGIDSMLWRMSRYDFEGQQMRIFIWVEMLDDSGAVEQKRYMNLDFSWIDPDQARQLLSETGYEIETVYGDLLRNPFTEDSGEHVWVARRPG